MFRGGAGPPGKGRGMMREKGRGSGEEKGKRGGEKMGKRGRGGGKGKGGRGKGVCPFNFYRCPHFLIPGVAPDCHAEVARSVDDIDYRR